MTREVPADPGFLSEQKMSPIGKTGLQLEDLNYDCLAYILSFTTWLERLYLEQLSTRFQPLVKDNLNAGETFDLDDIIDKASIDDTKTFLSRHGSQIKKISCKSLKSVNYLPYIELIPEYCNNLEELVFHQLVNISCKGYSRIFRANPNLQKIDLTDCFHITDRVCAQIAQLHHLTHLNLSNNWKFTGKHLEKLKNLKELLLNRCAIRSECMISICKAVQLKKLDITLCNGLDEETYLTIVETQNELETLIISDTYEAMSEILMGLKNLKHLEIRFNNDTNLLGVLVEKKSKTLETLTLNSFGTVSPFVKDQISKLSNIRVLQLHTHSDLQNQFVDDEYLLEIAKNCSELRQFICPRAGLVTVEGVVAFVRFATNLEKVNFSYSDLTEQVYDDIVKILEKEVGLRKPLRLCVYGTKISPDFIKTSEYRSHRHLLTLCFDDHSSRKL